jgi:peptide deformylase
MTSILELGYPRLRLVSAQIEQIEPPLQQERTDLAEACNLSGRSPTGDAPSHVPPERSEFIRHEIDHLDGALFTDRMIPQWGAIDRELRQIALPMSTKS